MCLDWDLVLKLLLLLLSRFSRVRLCETPETEPTRPHRPWDSPGKNTGVGCHFLLQCMKVKSQSEVAQSCPTLRNPMDCSLPGSSVHEIFQAVPQIPRILCLNVMSPLPAPASILLWVFPSKSGPCPVYALLASKGQEEVN